MNTLGIYIHVPFCGKKCAYCDFYSVNYSATIAEQYVQAVLRNLCHYSDTTKEIDTIYFGGGTPSLLSQNQIVRIVEEICKNFSLSKNAEITLEANPCTLTVQKLENLRESGVNRLSIGVQSMLDDELLILGRVHNSERAIKAVLDAKSAGFENISCDLMIALPNQTKDKLKRSAECLANLPIQHISSYILKTEMGTPFDCDEMQRLLPDDNEVAELYFETVNIMEEYGFMQYEVSNFSKLGFESKHNCRYWKCYDYIGIGPAAHSCYKGKRFAVARDLESFVNSPIQQIEITEENPYSFEEFAMLRLRLKEGLNLCDVPNYRKQIEKKLPNLIKAGYADISGDNVYLTTKGFIMSNSVIEYLIL